MPTLAFRQLRQNHVDRQRPRNLAVGQKASRTQAAPVFRFIHSFAIELSHDRLPWRGLPGQRGTPILRQSLGSRIGGRGESSFLVFRCTGSTAARIKTPKECGVFYLYPIAKIKDDDRGGRLYLHCKSDGLVL